MPYFEENKRQEEAADYQHYEVAGSHFEIGKQTGEHAQSAIILETSTSAKSQQFMEECLNLTQTVYPEIIEEMEGYANHFGIDLETLLPHLTLGLEGGCSGIAVLHREGMLVGRNYDFFYFENRRHLIYTKPTRGYAHIGIHEGLVGGRFEGLNQHGLFVSFNGAGEFKHPPHPGMTFHHVVRYLLERAKSAKEAKELLMELPVIEPKSYLLVDAKTAFVIETHPLKKRTRTLEGGRLIMTNHFVDKEMEPFHGPWPNSVARYNALDRAAQTMLQADTKMAAMAGLQDVLRDHDAPVCGHVDGLATFWSCTVDFTGPRIQYALGAPCRHPYQTYFSFE